MAKIKSLGEDDDAAVATTAETQQQGDLTLSLRGLRLMEGPKLASFSSLHDWPGRTSSGFTTCLLRLCFFALRSDLDMSSIPFAIRGGDPCRAMQANIVQLARG